MTACLSPSIFRVRPRLRRPALLQFGDGLLRGGDGETADGAPHGDVARQFARRAARRMVERHVQIAAATVQEDGNDIVAIHLRDGSPDLSGPVCGDEIGGRAADVVRMLGEIDEHADGFAVHVADADGVQLFVYRAGGADAAMRKAFRTIGLP